VEDYLTTNFTLLTLSADTVTRNSKTQQTSNSDGGYTKCMVRKPHSHSHLEDKD